MKDIVLFEYGDDGVEYPPASTPLTPLLTPAICSAAVIVSPKSTAFPKDAMVINSMIFSKPGDAPPAKTPRVGELTVPTPFVVLDKSPKSVASPVEGMVIN